MRVTTRTTKVVSGLCMSSRRHDTTAIVCTALLLFCDACTMIILLQIAVR